MPSNHYFACFNTRILSKDPMRTQNHIFFGGHRKRVLTLADQHPLYLSVFAFELPTPCSYLENIDFTDETPMFSY